MRRPRGQQPSLTLPQLKRLKDAADRLPHEQAPRFLLRVARNLQMNCGGRIAITDQRLQQTIANVLVEVLA